VAQRVQYRRDDQQTWVTAATVGPTISQYDVSSLDSEWIYHFRVINVCGSGGTGTTHVIQQALVTCNNNISYFLTPAGDIEYVFSPVQTNGISYFKISLFRQNGTEAASNIHPRKPGELEVRGSFTGLAPDPQYTLVKIDVLNEDYKASCGPVNVLVCQEVNTVDAILNLYGGARKLFLNWTPSVLTGIPNNGYRIRYKALTDTVYKTILIPRTPAVSSYTVENLTLAEQDGVEGFIDAMCSDTVFTSKAFVSIMGS
jgi:hypothetical protein